VKQGHKNIFKALELARRLLILAGQGDAARTDVGCGVLYGVIRDCAYKIRRQAEQELAEHKAMGIWPENKNGKKKDANSAASRRTSDAGSEERKSTFSEDSLPAPDAKGRLLSWPAGRSQEKTAGR